MLVSRKIAWLSLTVTYTKYCCTQGTAEVRTYMYLCKIGGNQFVAEGRWIKGLYHQDIAVEVTYELKSLFSAFTYDSTTPPPPPPLRWDVPYVCCLTNSGALARSGAPWIRVHPRNFGSEKIVCTSPRSCEPRWNFAFQASARFGGKLHGHPDLWRVKTTTKPCLFSNKF